MKDSVNWLKIASMAGMVLSFIGSLVSDYASKKQNSEEMEAKIKEEVKRYFEEDNIA